MRACTFKSAQPIARSPRGQASRLALAAAAFLLLAAGVAQAESAWVRGEVRLNVRTGPGTQFRIVGGLKTGDHLEIQERREKWIKVGLDDGTDGWIPVGYLESEAPATVKLAELESETTVLRETSAANSQQLAELKASNQALTQQDEEQRLEIDQLRRENMRLKAGARWPEWITGAAIVCVGMIVGAILHRSSGRRASPRIKL